MQKCTYCGAELPESARFCGKCGNVQGTVATDAATTLSNTPPPPPPPMPLMPPMPSYNYPTPTYPTPAYPVQGVQPSWSTGGSGSGTPPPTGEDEDERKGFAAWTPLYGAGMGADMLMGSGQAYAPGAPVVQGAPQIGGVPQVGGSPTPFTNAPAGHLAQTPSQAPGFQSPHASYPQAGQQAPQQAGQQAPQQVPQHFTHYPPQQHGTPEHHQIPEHHEHHEHHARHAHHLHHAAAGATKVAGGSAIKTIVIVVTAIVVVGAGGVAAAAYFLLRPQPLISISSGFRVVGGALAGARGTTLNITGSKFSNNSTITFLLDGNPAPGNASAHSDAHGNFHAAVKITNAWTVGTHTLTARDASNNTTQNSVRVTIVQPGQANTPGPNGAPPDDATFALGSSLQGQFIGLNQTFSTTIDLAITGHPDPAGGSVCTALDDGKVHFYNYSTANNATPYNENAAFTCKGTYKGGKVTYDRTILSDVITFTNTPTAVSCTLNGAHPYMELTGTYTSNGTFTGSFNKDAIPQSDYACSDGTASNFYYYNIQGTWTGTVSGLKD